MLSRSYSYILYKDSVEDKDIPKFFTDAQEYVNRIYGSAPVRNQYHSKILESVVWEIESDRIGWFKDFLKDGDSETVLRRMIGRKQKRKTASRWLHLRKEL